MSAVQIVLLIGHEATKKSKVSPEGYTHDWTLFVRGVDNADISQYVDKVSFTLHDSFPKPKRVVKEPPYSIRESGYAGFNLPIDIYFKSKNEEPKKLQFTYDMDLQKYKEQREEYVVQPTTDEFRRKLLKGGGVLINDPGSGHAKAVVAPKPSQPEKKHKHEPKVSSTFATLFGTPITKSSLKVSPDPAKVAQQKVSPKQPASSKLLLPSDKHSSAANAASSSSTSSSQVSKPEKSSKHKHSSPNKERDKERKGDKEKRDKSHSKDKSSKDKSQKRPKSPSSPKRSGSSPSVRSSSSVKSLDDKPPKGMSGVMPTPPGAIGALPDDAKSTSSSGSKKSSKKDKKSSDKERKSTSDKEKIREKSSGGGGAGGVTELKSSSHMFKEILREKASKHEQASQMPKLDQITEAPPLLAPTGAVATANAVKPETPRSDSERKHKHKRKDKSKDHKSEKSGDRESSKEKRTKKESRKDASKTPKEEPPQLRSPLKTPKHESHKEPPPPPPPLPLRPSKQVSDVDSSEEEETEVASTRSYNSTASRPAADSPLPPVLERQHKQRGEKRHGSDKEERRRKRKREEPPPVAPPPPLSSPDHSSSPDDEDDSPPPPLPPPTKVRKEEPLKNGDASNSAGESTGGGVGAPASTTTTAAAATKSTCSPRTDLDSDYMSELRELQHKIMTLQDNNELQQVVEMIAETGRYEITSKTFDFDLCALDRATVRRLQEFFTTATSCS